MNGNHSADATVDRVRAHTTEEVNAHIDRETEARVHRYASRSREEIGRRIEELDREWDVERLLQTNASTLVLFGLAMAAVHRRAWLVLPGVVFSFFLQHAMQGWCPPVPVFRRLGVRTRQEIDREKYALKALRGDFNGAPAATGKGTAPEAALEAVGA